MLLSDQLEIYEHFDFRLDGFHDPGTEPPLLLFVWLHFRIDIKPTLGNLRVQARNVFINYKRKCLKNSRMRYNKSSLLDDNKVLLTKMGIGLASSP